MLTTILANVANINLFGATFCGAGGSSPILNAGVAVTTVYRYKNVVGQVGFPSFVVYNIGYSAPQVAGVTVGTGNARFTRRPEVLAEEHASKAGYYLAFYSGNQLRRDPNQNIGLGKNWKLPFFWAPLHRYITGPVLAIVFSFAYPGFQTVKNDPMHIFGFIVAHFLLLCIALGFVVPKLFDVFVPRDRRNDGELLYTPYVTRGSTEAESEESGASVLSGEKVEEPGAKQCEVVRKLTMTRGPEIEIEV
ncbi:hypothetical protein LTR67_000612 [Exophiala xenobiotica]